MESVLNTSSRGGVPNKKDGRAPRTFQGLENRIWYLLRGPTSKGRTAGAFAVPLRVWS